MLQQLTAAPTCSWSRRLRLLLTLQLLLLLSSESESSSAGSVERRLEVRVLAAGESSVQRRVRSLSRDTSASPL